MLLRIFLLLHLSLVSFNSFSGECVSLITVNSSQGYQVHVSLILTHIVKPMACPGGYNYNIGLSYDISFSGNLANVNLYTLQGNIICGANTNNTFNLPNGGGIGTTVSGGNSWRPINDCNIATPGLLQCNQIQLIIQGNGIAYQTIPINCTSTLPVELAYFTAEEKDLHTELNWMTYSELNNDYFEVQKSIDGENWELMTSISGAGTSNSPNTYQWIDYSRTLAHTSYYRLKQVDFDGTYKFYDIQSVVHQEFELFLAPNPAQEITTVYSFDKLNISDFKLIASQGSEIAIDNIIGSIDEYKASLNTSNLPKGIYIISYKSYTKKLVVN